MDSWGEEMFNLLQAASDDQTALGACALTLAGAAFLLFVSFHFGPAGQKSKIRQTLRAGEDHRPELNVPSNQPRERAA